MTKISEIKIEHHVLVETKTDAHRYLMNDKDVLSYIREFGDVETVYDADYTVYRVPAFRESIEAYTAMKLADCRRYGCN